MKMQRRSFLAMGAAAAATPMGIRSSAAEPAADVGILRTPALPELRVLLPTDVLPPPQGPPKRIAAVTTLYRRYSHADNIITRFMEGYSIVGRTHIPHCRVVSLSIEQTPAIDIGRAMAARAGTKVFDSPAGALTLGGSTLAVDGVLLVAEHGDYPLNEKGQRLYPRRELFEQIVTVFRRSGRSVPVFNDKHLSYSWEHAQWMYQQSRELGFAMMAGSSVPVTWRRPPLAFRPGIQLGAALAIGHGGIESYGFHTLELLQAFVERRRGGETGVRAVQALEGERAWKAAEAGRWDAALLAAGLAGDPDGSRKLRSLDELRRADPNATVFLVDYRDGFQAAAYVARSLTDGFGFAARVVGLPQPVLTWCYLPKPQRDHFSFLCNHIELMFRTGKTSYPLERTYLVTGVLAALMESRFAGGQLVPTPHLADLRYEPAPELTEA